MAKARAKIVVPAPYGLWCILLDTDLGLIDLQERHNTSAKALARARAWSRRLGNIPVEVEE